MSSPSHVRLRFGALRLAVQNHDANGPIQQLEVCLHAEWQSTLNPFKVHLLGPDASDLRATTGGSSGPVAVIPIGAVDGKPATQYMVINMSEDDDEDCDDVDAGDDENRKEYGGGGRDSESQVPSKPPNSSRDGQKSNRRRSVSEPSPCSAPANYIVDVGLIRLYPDPQRDRDRTPPSPPRHRHLRLRGILPPGVRGVSPWVAEHVRTAARMATIFPYAVAFLCGVSVACILILLNSSANVDVDDVDGLPRAVLDAANRTINIHLNYASVPRSMLLAGEALFGNPIEYGPLVLLPLVDGEDGPSPLLPSPVTGLTPHHSRLVTLNSAGAFVPEYFFLNDIRVILRYIRTDLVDIAVDRRPPPRAQAHMRWRTTESTKAVEYLELLLDEAESALHGLQRLHSRVESELVMSWGERAAAAGSGHADRLSQVSQGLNEALQGVREDRARDSFFTSAARRLRDAYRNLGRQGRRQLSRTAINKGDWGSLLYDDLSAAFADGPPFPVILGRRGPQLPVLGYGSDDMPPPEHLVIDLFGNLTRTIPIIHEIAEHIENTTAASGHGRVLLASSSSFEATAAALLLGTAGLGMEALNLSVDQHDDDAFAAARVSCVAPFFRNVALPRLGLLYSRAAAGRRLLRNILLAQHELIDMLAQPAVGNVGSGGGGTGPASAATVLVKNLVADAKAAQRWVTDEALDVNKVFWERQKAFFEERSHALAASRDGRLPLGLVYSRWSLHDDRQVPYGPDRVVIKDRASIKRDAAAALVGDTRGSLKRKWRRLWPWKQ